MSITIQDVRRIAELACLELTDDEATMYSGQLSQIVDYVEKLNAIDTDHVDITYHPVAYGDVFREDEIGECLSVDDALANAPQKSWQYFAVPKVVG